ncbi:MAG: hypothetical protein HY673_20900 [Chloroflexi bacterium]|nr:hypothetical protein [Chloroflexota bacterium]
MSPRMKRIQLYIEPEVDQELQRLAAVRRVSKARLVREGVSWVVRENRGDHEDSLLKIVGMGESEPDRLSENHDEYLIEQEMKHWNRLVK